MQPQAWCQLLAVSQLATSSEHCHPTAVALQALQGDSIALSAWWSRCSTNRSTQLTAREAIIELDGAYAASSAWQAGCSVSASTNRPSRWQGVSHVRRRAITFASAVPPHSCAVQHTWQGSSRWAGLQALRRVLRHHHHPISAHRGCQFCNLKQSLPAFGSLWTACRIVPAALCTRLSSYLAQEQLRSYSSTVRAFSAYGTTLTIGTYALGSLAGGTCCSTTPADSKWSRDCGAQVCLQPTTSQAGCSSSATAEDAVQLHRFASCAEDPFEARTESSGALTSTLCAGDCLACNPTELSRALVPEACKAGSLRWACNSAACLSCMNPTLDPYSPADMHTGHTGASSAAR